MTDTCSKHGPYSVFCRMCDLETVVMTDTTDAMVAEVARILTGFGSTRGLEPEQHWGPATRGVWKHAIEKARSIIAALATRPDPSVELMEALKLAREWVEGTSLACVYCGCTPDPCASKRAEQDLAIIDAAITNARGEGHAPLETP